MKRLLLIGAGGHGKVAADVANECGYENVHFIDQNYAEKKTNGIWDIIAADVKSASTAQGLDEVFVCIGDNASRAKQFDILIENEIVNLIHPRSIVSKFAKFGNGNLVAAGAVVNADAVIGNGVILNTSCSVDHDCTIGNFVHISPGANIAGGCRIGDKSWIGIGACVREGVEIGSNVIVGAGSVVINDIPNNALVVGSPAKPIS